MAELTKSARSVHPRPPATNKHSKRNSQDPRTGGTDEGTHCHVDIGRAALVAVEAFPIRGKASHFPEHLQMSLLLLSLRTRCHCENSGLVRQGDELSQKSRGREGVLGVNLS